MADVLKPLKPWTWEMFKADSPQLPEPESYKAQTVDDINLCERIRVMHVGQHPTSRFYPLNGLPAEEVHRRGLASFWMHQLGKEPTLAQVKYAISPQFQLDKDAFKETQ